MHASTACKYMSAIVCSLALAALAPAADADLIGINFDGGNNGAPAGGVLVTGPAGVLSQSNWNNESGSSANSQSLVFSDGSASGATVTYSSNDPWSTGKSGTTQNGDLLQGYIDNLPSKNAIVSLANLPSSIAGAGSTPYNVFVYIASDTANRGGNYILNNTITTTTAVLINSGPQADGTFLLATPGTDAAGTGAVAGNYYEFTNVTGTSFSITAQATIDPVPLGTNQRAPIDAIQISSVPEPASLAALTLLAVPLLARRRRKNGMAPASLIPHG